MRQVHRCLEEEDRRQFAAPSVVGQAVVVSQGSSHESCRRGNAVYFEKNLGQGECRLEPGLPRPDLLRLRRVSEGAPQTRSRTGSSGLRPCFLDNGHGRFSDHGVRCRTQATLIFLACVSGTIGYLVEKTPFGMACLSGFYFLYTMIAISQAALEWSYLYFERKYSACESRSTSTWHTSPARNIAIHLLDGLRYFNCLLLLFIMLARTLGLYNSCWCRFIQWIPAGGRGTFTTPITGTQTGFTEQFIPLLLPTLFAFVALVCLVYTWWAHSHLGGEDLQTATKDMIRVRRFRGRTSALLRIVLRERGVNVLRTLCRRLYS